MKRASRALISLILGLGMTASAFAATVTTYPQSTQSDTESDRQQAIDTATQNAENWANSQCIGNVVETSVISTNVVNLGDNDNPSYMATVTARATCQFETRR